MTDLAGKVVVVTGAADGIGRTLASACAAQGARLVLADIDGPQVERVGEELSHTEVLTAVTDVSDRQQVLALRDAAVARFGTVHVLCNNAGVMGPAGDPLWELPLGEWQRVLAVNFFGVLHGIEAFLPVLLASGAPGHVLNTASMQGVTSGTLIPEYAVSKHAVVALSEALAAQLAARNAPIGVTVLCPGAVRTRLAAKEQDRLAGLGQAWAEAPGGRHWGDSLTPEEVARAAVAAVRRNSRFVFTNPGSRARVTAALEPILTALNESESSG